MTSNPPQNLGQSNVQPPLPPSQMTSQSTPELTKEGWQKVHREFAELHRIGDPIERDYKLIQYAKDSEIPTDRYYAMFEGYQERSARGVKAVVNTLARTASFLGQFTILAGLILFIAEADTRKKEAHNRAWETVRDARELTESAGRIEALQTLTAGCAYGEMGDTLRGFPVVQNFMPDCISLRGLAVEGAFLPEINLQSAELKNARMQGAGLWGAFLQNADLTGAQLQRARLSEAKLQGAILRNAQLNNADLQRVDFSCDSTLGISCKVNRLENANLSGANLTNAVLGNADLSQTILDGVQYNDATLRGIATEASRSILKNANTYRIDTEANLVGKNLNLVELSDATLTRAQLMNATLNGINLRKATLVEADLTGAKLNCQPLSGEGSTQGITADSDRPKQCANLRSANFTSAILNNTELIGADLTGAILRQADLTNAVLAQTDLNGADFTDAIGLTPEQIKQARNWALAKYDDAFRAQLGLAFNPDVQQSTHSIQTAEQSSPSRSL
ncbi:MAG: pentapeptide repeat-containing protein [Elainellaceae cyanobacterium]